MTILRDALKLLCLFSLLGILGCSSSPTVTPKALVTASAETPRLLDTLAYIPKRKVDEKTGQMLAYRASTNPYTALTGKIDADLVQPYVQARRAFKAGKLLEAKNLLKPLTKADAGLSGPWVMLGDIRVRESKLDEAIKHYQQAIATNKVNVNAYLRLAKVQRQRGDFISAQNTYGQALSVWPDFPEAHLNLAVLYDIYLNKPVKAQRHMESYQFLTGGKDKERARWLAEIQQRTGKAIELEVELSRAVSVSSNNL